MDWALLCFGFLRQNSYITLLFNPVVLFRFQLFIHFKKLFISDRYLQCTRSVMPNTHRRRRRDETGLSRRRCEHEFATSWRQFRRVVGVNTPVGSPDMASVSKPSSKLPMRKLTDQCRSCISASPEIRLSANCIIGQSLKQIIRTVPLSCSYYVCTASLYCYSVRCRCLGSI